MTSARAAFWALLALGAALRLTGIGYGLPAVFNSDEPHLVNVAVSFGGGTLNPGLFKYPTLWMYTLAAAYGVWFAGWSGLGLLHSAREFGQLFAWEPGGFYLLARLLSAAFSLAALERVHRAGRLLWGDAAGLAAAGTLAVAPVLTIAAHAAKPESLMFFLAAWAWWFAARYAVEGRGRDLLLAGAAVGLSVSTQYTAAPLGTLLPAAWVARRMSGAARPADLAGAAACAGAAFFAGSPYILLEFGRFRATFQDLRVMDAAGAAPVGLWPVLRNMVHLAGARTPAELAFAAGAVWLCRSRRPLAVLVLMPLAAFLLAFSRSSEGSWQRYLLAAFPGVALAAGAAVQALLERAGARRRAAGAALAVALLAPGAWQSAAFDREVLLPDTRTLSAEWIAANVPEGKTLLLDQEHASPRLTPSRAMVGRLLEQTTRSGHPRRRYWELLRDAHPGGGYDVYRVLRDFRDLRSYPGHVAFSAAGQPMLDVRSGLAAARAAGVDVIVLSSFGADPARSPELRGFLDEVERSGAPLARFEPEPGRRTGPTLRVFGLR